MVFYVVLVREEVKKREEEVRCLLFFKNKGKRKPWYEINVFMVFYVVGVREEDLFNICSLLSLSLSIICLV